MKHVEGPALISGIRAIFPYVLDGAPQGSSLRISLRIPSRLAIALAIYSAKPTAVAQFVRMLEHPDALFPIAMREGAPFRGASRTA